MGTGECAGGQHGGVLEDEGAAAVVFGTAGARAWALRVAGPWQAGRASPDSSADSSRRATPGSAAARASLAAADDGAMATTVAGTLRAKSETTREAAHCTGAHLISHRGREKVCAEFWVPW